METFGRVTRISDHNMSETRVIDFINWANDDLDKNNDTAFILRALSKLCQDLRVHDKEGFMKVTGVLNDMPESFAKTIVVGAVNTILDENAIQDVRYFAEPFDELVYLSGRMNRFYRALQETPDAMLEMGVVASWRDLR